MPCSQASLFGEDGINLSRQSGSQSRWEVQGLLFPGKDGSKYIEQSIG
jgi:hypothetical protein